MYYMEIIVIIIIIVVLMTLANLINCFLCILYYNRAYIPIIYVFLIKVLL